MCLKQLYKALVLLKRHVQCLTTLVRHSNQLSGSKDVLLRVMECAVQVAIDRHCGLALSGYTQAYWA